MIGNGRVLSGLIEVDGGVTGGGKGLLIHAPCEMMLAALAESEKL